MDLAGGSFRSLPWCSPSTTANGVAVAAPVRLTGLTQVSAFSRTRGPNARFALCAQAYTYKNIKIEKISGGSRQKSLA